MDYTVTWKHVIYGPLLFSRQPPEDATQAKVPNYAVVQNGEEEPVEVNGQADEGVLDPKGTSGNSSDGEKTSHAAPSAPTHDQKLILAECNQKGYQRLLLEARERHHAKLRKSRGPLGWAMRTLHANPMGAGSIYERHNIVTVFKRIPAMITVALLYGMHYDIHTAQVGIEGTPEGVRMQRVYDKATKYPNEVEYLYSFVQVITACTASFAHGANDVGNAVGVWAAMYSAWSTGEALTAKSPVELWQIAVMALTICIGFITYGYNIMKGKRWLPPPFSF
jgi:sodium-dependent phosphate transporter